MDDADSASAEPPDSRSPSDEAVVDLADGGLLAPEASAWLRRHARLALAELAAGGELRVRLLRDAAMTNAHQQHLGDPVTTDVLTFDLSEGESSRTRSLDADVLVCVDEAQRQAARRGVPPERELLLYVLHAALHCLGYNDFDGASSAAMHAREDEVLEAIGVGATYALGEAGGR